MKFFSKIKTRICNLFNCRKGCVRKNDQQLQQMGFPERDLQTMHGDEIPRMIARNMGKSPEEVEAFVQSVNKILNELNLAPDISHLDNEENKLFSLAEEGAKMLDNLFLGMFPKPSSQLSKAVFIEARILCSTIVMDLTPDFKNEIDLDKQEDRYFLLLHNSTVCDSDNFDDIIGFLNKRIDFYNKNVKTFIGHFNYANDLINNSGIKDSKAIENIKRPSYESDALKRIFDALYKHPGQDYSDSQLFSGIYYSFDLYQFGGELEKVIKHLQDRSHQLRYGV